MNYEQSVDYLLALLGTGGQHYGLERITGLVEVLGHPDRSFRSIHIAGTNGKGSTGAMIEAGLRAAGRSTGFFSSPHLSEFTERFRLGGVCVDREEFATCITLCRQAAEQLEHDTNGQLRSTMFEITTAAAFCCFQRAGVTWAVIETGLGGRLDSTNVIEPELTVITPVAMDHQATLGDDLGAIAGEKAGIFKPQAGAVISHQHPAAREILADRAVKHSKSVTWAGEVWSVVEQTPNDAGCFRIRVDGPEGKRVGALLGLPGAHQIENAVTAIAALDAVGVTTNLISQGLTATEWAGRLEWLRLTPDVLLDAAHNPAGARSLAEFLARFCSARRMTLIFSASKDKDVDEIAAALFPLVDRVILTRSAVARSEDPETLAGSVGHHGKVVEIAEDSGTAWERAAMDKAPDHLVVIAGSIFLVGELRVQLAVQGNADA